MYASLTNNEFIYSGSADLASTWEARPCIGRKMPDVTDVGPGQVWQAAQNNYVKEILNSFFIKEKEHKASAEKYVSYLTSYMMSGSINANQDAELSNSLKKPNSSSTTVSLSKEETNCDDLICLSGPCTEAFIINVLRSRFTKNLFQVYLKW